MNELYEKSLHKLELDKVLCLLADQACSASGKEQCLKTQPLSDADEIRLLQKQTSAACRMITLKGSPGLAGVSDVGASVDRAVRGGCLSPEELLRVAGVLKCARQAKAYADGEGMENDLNVFFAQITPNKYLEERIFTSIVSKDELADAASPELASIRRKIRRQSVAIREGLQKIITSPTYAKFLQEPIVTIRSDRFVVPVKAECKGSIPGLVHDVSSSGSTFFIEPMQAVNGNNALRELFVEERKEIERILTELSGEVAGHREHLAINYTVLTQLDCIFARAKLSFVMKATEPEIRTDGRLELKRARHPLITGKTVVPISVRLGSDFDTLIITGPNTGGKGAVAPNPYYTKELAAECIENIFLPTIRAMRAEGRPFRGCLYFGLMLTKSGPKVVEYNCRFGDPETQAVLPLLKSDLLTVMQATTNGTLADASVEFSTGSACCVVLASEGYPQKYESGFPITMSEEAAAHCYVAGAKKDGDTLLTAGGRVLGITAAAPTLRAAVEEAYQLAEGVAFANKYCRGDIGSAALAAREERG